MKRIPVLCAAAALLLLSACTGGQAELPPEKDPDAGTNVEITLWTYPVGGWGNSATVSAQTAAFQRANPGIKVRIDTIDYETGDSKVEEALAEKKAPDLILEGPERLVANWGARGLMVDLSDLWQEEPADEIEESVRVACGSKEKYYLYPLCMTTHCMAINKDMFEAAGALDCIDEESHTWTTSQFFTAIEKLHAHGMEEVCAVYCGGQGGDQGTRALVNNLYSGTFTNAEHTAYTVDSSQNIRALQELASTEGVVFDSELVGGTEIEKFCREELAMALCWNVYAEVNQTINKSFDFDIFPMAFPTDDGDINLQGGIWGFGIFDNGDAAKIRAAKKFIRYIMQDDETYASAVNASTYWPVREMPNLYRNDKLMNEYAVFGKYLGDYYQVTPGWPEARTAWWEMLQEIGAGGSDSVEGAVRTFTEKVNAALSET